MKLSHFLKKWTPVLNPARPLGAVVLSAAVLFLITGVGRAQSFVVLHSFNHNVPPHGEPLQPHWPGMIAQGRDGLLYTTSPVNGAGASGAVFRLSPSGAFSVVHPFFGPDGAFPDSGVTLGTDGFFYGSTSAGGSPASPDPNPTIGTVFKTTADGTVTVLHNFRIHDRNGINPYAPPVEGPDGNFYGTTPQSSTIYRITPSGNLQTIYTFGPNLGGVIAPLVLAGDGNLYGIGNNFNDSGYGSVFKVTPAGQLTWIYAFDKIHGAYSYAPLIQGTDGNFYGTTTAGGDNNDGVVFKLTPSGQITVLHSFNGSDGMTPYAGVVQGNDGNFYGATYAGGVPGFGTLYKVTPQGGFSLLHSFNGAAGANPMVTPTQHTNGVIYGDTYLGGQYTFGTFYSLDLGLPAFIRLTSSSGIVGSSVGILGQNLSSATSVLFNGVASPISAVSDTYATAIVPAGATTGPVMVTTSGGAYTSNTLFRVTPASTQAPFGSVDTPANNLTGVQGALAVTGWALSANGLKKIEFWREAVAGDVVPAGTLIFVSQASIVQGARPDVANAYPGLRGNDWGWGAQILTNELPSNQANIAVAGVGNGTYRIHVIATDNAGNTADLGTRILSTDNAHAILPFGTIDTPAAGETVSGSAYVNFGWALTPNPVNVISKDGSNIWVYIDDQPVGHPVYNNFRSDIATLFPGLLNSNGAVGYYSIDTTKLSNGLHTISWTATDNAGNAQGLGSRFFNVSN